MVMEGSQKGAQKAITLLEALLDPKHPLRSTDPKISEVSDSGDVRNPGDDLDLEISGDLGDQRDWSNASIDTRTSNTLLCTASSANVNAH